MCNGTPNVLPDMFSVLKKFLFWRSGGELWLFTFSLVPTQNHPKCTPMNYGLSSFLISWSISK